MPEINWKVLEAKAKDFNNIYHTTFSFSEFYSKIKSFVRLDPKNAANIVYKGTLGSVLKDTLIIACNAQRTSPSGKSGSVDLLNVVENFEESLMKPFVYECKRANEKPYPKAYGGMNEKQRLELVEHVLNASPKNDVELTERAYKSGKISLRNIREFVGELPFASGGAVDSWQIQRIGTFMLALENVNKSRPFWWKVIHPFRNNAEKRDAKEMRTVLKSFGGNALELAEKLAVKEYEAIELTKASVKLLKAELVNEKPVNSETVNERDHIKITLDNEIKTDVSDKINERENKQLTINKNNK